MSLAEAIRRRLSGVVELTDAQLSALEAHYALLLRWNDRINLTTVTELGEAAVRHYCESIFLGMRLMGGRAVVDVGSGAGFPGFPIAIFRGDCRVTLVEAHRRKAVFLREASRGVPNIEVLDVRAEGLRGRYDWLVSRGVAPVSVLKLRLAPRFAMLVSAEDATRLGIADVTPFPWDRHRVVAQGVSRGPDCCRTPPR